MILLTGRVVFWLSLLLAFWVYAFGFKEIVNDRTRDRLFELRHQLLLSATDGKIPFGSSAYLLLRHRINALIRFAHELNLIQVLVISIVMRISKDRSVVAFQRKQWSDATKELSFEQKAVAENIRNEMLAITMIHLVFASWLLRPLIPVAWIAAHLFGRPKAKIKHDLGAIASDVNLEAIAAFDAAAVAI